MMPPWLTCPRQYTWSDFHRYRSHGRKSHASRANLAPAGPDAASRADIGEAQPGIVKINKRAMRGGETMAGNDEVEIPIVIDVAPHRVTPGVFRFLNQPDLNRYIGEVACAWLLGPATTTSIVANPATKQERRIFPLAQRNPYPSQRVRISR